MSATRVTIQTTSESAWVSATDLMAGLMVLFMFVAVAFMENVSRVAGDWLEVKEKIYGALLEEFKEDLPRWNAQIERETLIVRFEEPTVLFNQGEVDLTKRFQDILAEFFPRYVQVLFGFAKDIAEIRIEGHTSSEWHDLVDQEMAYLRNMHLSQGRAGEVLLFSIGQLPRDAAFYSWGRDHLVASGFSSSKLIRDAASGQEDRHASRRVEFRVRTTADERLSRILIRARAK